MATLNHIGGAEPSTLTFKVRTVTQNQNSSVMHQEVLTLGDAESTIGLARVLAAKPASTEYGLVVREAASVFNIGSTAADNAVAISGNSTVFQGGSWTVRATLSSTSADNPVSISGNSTVVQGTNPWIVSPNSTGFVKAAGFSVDSSNYLNVKDTPASTSWVTLAGFAVDSSNFLNVKQDANTRLNIGSTAADNAVLATIGTNLQSSVAGSSNSSALLVRPIIDNVLTSASTSALAASTSFSVQSSAASLRSYVTAYSIMTTNAGPTTVKFMSGSTLLWPMQFAAVSSAISGANLAVSAPAYLFRTKTAGPLSLNTNGSTAAGWKVAVSYFRAS
jgi:hypothetical protein